MTRVAIMQPYLFPYVGYFQLVSSVDDFVVLDDVQVPNPGFVNRNRILEGGAPKWFSLPLASDSHSAPISSRRFLLSEQWTKKLVKRLRANYEPGDGRDAAEGLIGITGPESGSSSTVIDVTLAALEAALTVVGAPRPRMHLSSLLSPRIPDAQARLIGICQELGATTYLNLPGGKSLYSHEKFAEAGIRLGYIEPKAEPYTQRAPEFIPWLSILDVIACTDQLERCRVLQAFDIDFPGDS